MSKQSKSSVDVSIGIDTDYGVFVAVFSDKGLKRLLFPNIKFVHKPLKTAECADIITVHKDWIIATETGLNSHLKGIGDYKTPPLDLSDGTEFQQKVWKELLKIKWGKTKTYGEIAAALGNPLLARAVGMACGANPVPIFVPCHRVVAANGALGGFSAGLKWKKLLLEIESKNMNA